MTPPHQSFCKIASLTGGWSLTALNRCGGQSLSSGSTPQWWLVLPWGQLLGLNLKMRIDRVGGSKEVIKVWTRKKFDPKDKSCFGSKCFLSAGPGSYYLCPTLLLAHSRPQYVLPVECLLTWEHVHGSWFYTQSRKREALGKTRTRAKLFEKCSGALSAFDCDSTERMVDIHGSDGN